MYMLERTEVYLSTPYPNPIPAHSSYSKHRLSLSQGLIPVTQMRTVLALMTFPPIQVMNLIHSSPAVAVTDYTRYLPLEVYNLCSWKAIFCCVLVCALGLGVCSWVCLTLFHAWPVEDPELGLGNCVPWCLSIHAANLNKHLTQQSQAHHALPVRNKVIKSCCFSHLPVTEKPITCPAGERACLP